VLNAETNSWTDDDLARMARSLKMPVWFVHRTICVNFLKQVR
jgi:hypothetical protein